MPSAGSYRTLGEITLWEKCYELVEGPGTGVEGIHMLGIQECL